MKPDIAAKIDQFFSAFKLMRYQKGQILVHAEEDPKYVYHLVKGKVKEYDITYRGDEVILNLFQPPAFFPMSYAINRTPNAFFFEADTEVELHQAPIEDTVEFLKSNPDVMYDLLARVYRGTDGLLGRMAQLMSSGARSRVLYELLIECRRFGTKDGDGYVVAVSENDLGARAGLTRETVNREMHKLKSDGLVSVTPMAIRVPDIDRLTDALRGDV